MNLKSLLKYFLAGGLGGGIVSYVLSYIPIAGYLAIPYLSIVFSIFSGITTLIAGIILDLILKD